MAAADELLPRKIRWLADNSVLVLVQAGPFTRGTTMEMQIDLMRRFDANPDWFKDEKPARKITLSPFYVDIYPTTNRLYAAFCSKTGRKTPPYIRKADFNDPHFPVVGIDFDDAQAYCSWSGKRLPTEAEWEKAARGTTDRIFPWGDEYQASLLNAEGRNRGPTPVGSCPEGASPYGVQDLAGNVYEWVSDFYQPDYYGRSPESDPPGPQTGVSHVLRGGSWINNVTMVRCAERDFIRPPALSTKFIGFRAAISASTVMASRAKFEVI